MCGIAGIVGTNQIDRDKILPMLSCQVHRGPDEEGVWQSGDKSVLLGHRRLSIIDLSAGGRQPMATPDKKVVVTFNGEIYNYRELKEELCKKYFFRSQSDTEVLLNAYLEWGTECLKKLNGMFAFAIWDENKKMLFAARDRLGEKPFKYYHSGSTFIFASELKAILTNPEVPREIDWEGIDLALSFRYIPAPRTGFKNICKLSAGHFLILKNNELKIESYWDAGKVEPARKSFLEWKTQLWDVFTDSVKHRMISDVPLGAFLSGGLDSTSVVAAAQAVSSKPVSTFVIGEANDLEDIRYARLAASYFKTDHHEIQLSEIDYASALEKLIRHYDEPFFDQSALPIMLISEHIKKYVTVALSGDGSDELFGGYDSYGLARFLKNYQFLPVFIRKSVSVLAGLNKHRKYQAEILSRDFFGAYTEYFSLWKEKLPGGRYLSKNDLYNGNLMNILKSGTAASVMSTFFQSVKKDIVNNAMLADIRGRLADGYLAKVDYGSMASAVEVRPPFLDYRLVEMSQEIPSGLKIKKCGKYIWKEIVKDKIPTEIIERRKKGFALPLDLIIKNELRPMVEGVILADSSLISRYFNYTTMKKLWSDHLAGDADYSNHIWSLLMLELWLKKYF